MQRRRIKHTCRATNRSTRGCWRRHWGESGGRPPLFHLPAWDQNIQGNKNRGLWCAGRMTTVQLSPRSCEGGGRGGRATCRTSLFVPRYWNSAQIKGSKALIRGRVVSQVWSRTSHQTAALCHLDPKLLYKNVTTIIQSLVHSLDVNKTYYM